MTNDAKQFPSIEFLPARYHFFDPSFYLFVTGHLNVIYSSFPFFILASRCLYLRNATETADDSEIDPSTRIASMTSSGEAHSDMARFMWASRQYSHLRAVEAPTAINSAVFLLIAEGSLYVYMPLKINGLNIFGLSLRTFITNQRSP